jgi:hypothetical protein
MHTADMQSNRESAQQHERCVDAVLLNIVLGEQKLFANFELLNQTALCIAVAGWESFVVE